MICPICSLNTNLIQPDVFKCTNCSHIYVNFTGDGNNYHKVNYRKNKQGTRSKNEIKDNVFTKEFHEARIDICKKRIDKINNIIKESNSLLDIGAGGGTFLNLVNIPIKEGQEISDICIFNLNLQGYKTYHGDFCSMNFEKKYDLITCWHVLEHIKNVHDFVLNSHKICNNHLVIEVPTNRKIHDPKNNWDGHYHYFSKESIKLLFKDKFEIISIENGVQSPSILAILKKFNK